MNTKNNLRFQQTEERIVEVFINLLQEKEIHKISVSEICRLSEINRTSFYLHYTDVYNLMEKIEHNMSLYFGKLFTAPENYNLGDRFVRLFLFIQEHQNFYRVYLNNQKEMHLLEGIIPDSASASLQDMIKKLGFTKEHEYLYHQAFFKAGFTALVREWLNSGCMESPEELAEILHREYTPDKNQLFT